MGAQGIAKNGGFRLGQDPAGLATTLARRDAESGWMPAHYASVRTGQFFRVAQTGARLC
jgi:hypothetical protein